MRDPAPSPDCRLPAADCRHRERVGLYGWAMDVAGLAALALFVAGTTLLAGGLAG